MSRNITAVPWRLLPGMHDLLEVSSVKIRGRSELEEVVSAMVMAFARQEVFLARDCRCVLGSKVADLSC